MTQADDLVVKAINDTRALLDALSANGLRETHVRSDEIEIFIARDGGGSNPMRLVPAPTADTTPQPGPEIAPTVVARGPDIVMTAPHVATLEDVLAVGAVVVMGQKIGSLRVLDELLPIEAAVAGTITGLTATPGVLLDYKAPILTIAQAA